MLNGETPRLPQGPWCMNSARLTVFLSGEAPDIASLFKDVFGEEAENETKVRNELRHKVSTQRNTAEMSIETQGPMLHLKVEAEPDLAAEELLYPTLDEDVAKTF